MKKKIILAIAAIIICLSDIPSIISGCIAVITGSYLLYDAIKEWRSDK